MHIGGWGVLAAGGSRSMTRNRTPDAFFLNQLIYIAAGYAAA